ncbi:MAG: hypothetical protein EHM46_02905, partial [Bacteroidetes bacterium]
MKRNILLLWGLMSLAGARGQFTSFGFVAGAGHTVIDIEKAISWSPLEEWDRIAIILKGSADYALGKGLSLSGEFGVNRLYYWEYRWSDGYYSGSRWRSEWTTNLGIGLRKVVGESIFLQAGAGVHIFNDGSGTVPGLVFGGGYELKPAGRF